MVLTHFLKVQSLSCCLYTNPLCKVGHSRSLRGFLSEDRPVETYLYTANYNKEYSFCQDIIEKYAVVITVCLLKRYLTAKRASHGDGG